VRLYIPCGNLLINVDQQHNLAPQTNMHQMYNRYIVARLQKQFFLEKVISRTYSECVFLALLKQHASRILCIILSCFPYLLLPYVSTLSEVWHNFQTRRN